MRWIGVKATSTISVKARDSAFVNGHTHLSMCMFRGLGLDAMANNIVEPRTTE